MNSASFRLLVALLLFCLCAAAYAQGTPSPAPSVPGSTVPTWVFYWVLGLSTFVGTVLIAIIKTLWEKANKPSVLTEEERTWLREAHATRAEVPKVWVDLFSQIEQELKKSDATLKQLVVLAQGDKAQLQTQLRERLELHDRQQAKMLKLAVRVQRAVEALAGLKTPEIEDDLNDAGEEV